MNVLHPKLARGGLLRSLMVTTHVLRQAPRTALAPRPQLPPAWDTADDRQPDPVTHVGDLDGVPALSSGRGHRGRQGVTQCWMGTLSVSRPSVTAVDI